MKRPSPRRPTDSSASSMRSGVSRAYGASAGESDRVIGRFYVCLAQVERLESLRASAALRRRMTDLRSSRDSADRRRSRFFTRECTMKVTITEEIKTHEYRIGLTPETVREFFSRRHEIVVETGA